MRLARRGRFRAAPARLTAGHSSPLCTALTPCLGFSLAGSSCTKIGKTRTPCRASSCRERRRALSAPSSKRRCVDRDSLFAPSLRDRPDVLSVFPPLADRGRQDARPGRVGPGQEARLVRHRAPDRSQGGPAGLLYRRPHDGDPRQHLERHLLLELCVPLSLSPLVLFPRAPRSPVHPRLQTSSCDDYCAATRRSSRRRRRPPRPSSRSTRSPLPHPPHPPHPQPSPIPRAHPHPHRYPAARARARARR